MKLFIASVVLWLAVASEGATGKPAAGWIVAALTLLVFYALGRWLWNVRRERKSART